MSSTLLNSVDKVVHHRQIEKFRAMSARGKLAEECWGINQSSDGAQKQTFPRRISGSELHLEAKNAPCVHIVLILILWYNPM